MRKIHQEHGEASNKGIINIENNIRNINNWLAKQANKISEQMKSFEKTDSFVKELWRIEDSLAGSRSLWFIVDKNGKAQKPSEPTKKPNEAKKSEQFRLLIFGDSITKNISPSAIVNPICHRGHNVPAADSFVCCGSIRDFEKVKFSENF